MEQLSRACTVGDIDTVKQLIEQGCDPKFDDSYVIRLASINNHLDIVKYLVSVGCDPTTNNNMPIKWASRLGHLDVVKYLVSQGCDPGVCGNYPFEWALKQNHLDIVEYFLECGYDYKTVDKKIKYKVLQDVKIRLLAFMNIVKDNYYLKMEIIKSIISGFTEWEIMNVLK